MSFDKWNLAPEAVLEAIMKGVPPDVAPNIDVVRQRRGSDPAIVGIAGLHGQFLTVSATPDRLRVFGSLRGRPDFEENLPRYGFPERWIELITGLTRVYFREFRDRHTSSRFSALEMPNAPVRLRAMLLLRPSMYTRGRYSASPVGFEGAHLLGTVSIEKNNQVHMDCVMRRAAAGAFLNDLQVRLSQEPPPSATSPSSTFTTFTSTA